ncbi:MAG: PASTA domain-containing protein [Paludibacteraceae bacterium]|nr:PASTA domain-containing protein [Paludibacteraceae bacterium]
MDIRHFFNETTGGWIVKNLIVALVVVVIGIITVTLWLRSYTEHGVEVLVPQVIGLSQDEAAALIAENDLRLEVIDSTYTQLVPLGAIVEQNPVANSHAKHRRTIYVVINANSVRQVPMPDLRDISFRQAEATLHSVGLKIKEYIYEPSEFKDIVLDVRMEGQSIQPGERISQGSEVVLVIGKGKGTARVMVPNLVGKDLLEARSLLLSSYLTMGSIHYDEEPTEETEGLYFVYNQQPTAGSYILEGSIVDIQLSTDLEKAVVQSDESDNEDFF